MKVSSTIILLIVSLSTTNCTKETQISSPRAVTNNKNQETKQLKKRTAIKKCLRAIDFVAPKQYYALFAACMVEVQPYRLSPCNQAWAASATVDPSVLIRKY